MAEILLSLTIIGVVAAITLPSLTGNINERTWNTQRKALYARMSQAIALMPALNGYGTLTEGNESTSAVDTAAETFVTEGLSEVLKINNICDSEHLADCGIPSTINTLNASIISMPTTMEELNPEMVSVFDADYGGTSLNLINTKATAFETQNGESLIVYYNPSCVANMGETSRHFVQPKICANMIYDLNGAKGPNTVGKDIGFLSVLYPSDSSVVAPVPYNRLINGFTSAEASRACTQNVGEEYRLPTKDESVSLFINRRLLGYAASTGAEGHWFTSSKYSNTSGAVRNWVMVQGVGQLRVADSDSQWHSLCVKRY